ncbi:outer membrane protein assembly factor BamD [Eionea flava]
MMLSIMPFSSALASPFILFRTVFQILKRGTLAFICLCVFLTGCTSSTISLSSNGTEAELYEQVQKDLRRDNFLDAIKYLQIMEKKFPFGEYSKSAQLSLIYAHYGFGENEAATAAANRFIRLHPKHRNVDYAYYMKGLIIFPKQKTFIQQAFNADLSKRDISSARASFNHFTALTQLFPDSEYAPDALKRMIFLRNLLARNEIHIANYYLERKAYLAAANRGRYVVENFQETSAVPDALAVMIQAYHEMNIDDLSNDSLNVLRANFPDHPALNNDGGFNYSYSTTSIGSWLSKVSFGVLGTTKPPGFNSESRYNSVSD